jgi:RecA/RadA recombinase
MLTIDEYQARALQELDEAQARYSEQLRVIQEMIAESNRVATMIRALRATIGVK